MKNFGFLSIADQVAAHLQAEIHRGRWTHSLPGKHRLANELGVNNKTVEAALQQLEAAGVLVSRGAGRTRLIHESVRATGTRLRIMFLTNESPKHDPKYPLVIEVHNALTEAGHTLEYTQRSMTDLGFDEKRVASLVRRTPADAWIIGSGSRNILEWFSTQPLSALALFGHRHGVPIASVGPDKASSYAEATETLLRLGHRRIVLLCRRLRRVPEPGRSERGFLEAMYAHGIPPSDYYLPDWEETPEGFQRLLEALFRVTPPSALIVDEMTYFVAALQFLAGRGIRVPADVSLVCTDYETAFVHCHPPVSCIAWDTRPMLRRVAQWASNVSHGRPDTRCINTPSTFIHGGTIGPAAAQRA
ncbi:substrate-binding domain-containing protein [Prosthecobacter vanneervenii]|uniref:DNA-binding LacI/PurR family transcriptional regulator n=1 Tax=Prosthecobacter vanneervenii TaxID=48466 RepID=A0A7W7Y7W5_9BACT|nr:substrate-binding domain-containing protein [Prosthecobacter vanneervenii]MBB5030855.1 DNA-binding LacI/PurR family transcriptional regulator [Prosthecobacter vanneervenii]